MITRDALRRLVDELPERELEAAARFLEYLRDSEPEDPFEHSLAEAPEDDEPLTPEDEEHIRQGLEEYRRGAGRPWEKVRKELAGE